MRQLSAALPPLPLAARASAIRSRTCGRQRLAFLAASATGGARKPNPSEGAEAAAAAHHRIYLRGSQVGAADSAAVLKFPHRAQGVLTRAQGVPPHAQGAKNPVLKMSTGRSAKILLCAELCAELFKLLEHLGNGAVTFLNGEGAIRGAEGHGIGDALFSGGDGGAFVDIEKLNLFKELARSGADGLFKACGGNFVVADNGKVAGGRREARGGLELLVDYAVCEDVRNIHGCHIRFRRSGRDGTPGRF